MALSLLLRRRRYFSPPTLLRFIFAIFAISVSAVPTLAPFADTPRHATLSADRPAGHADYCH
jgi:hypothetical protein